MPSELQSTAATATQFELPLPFALLAFFTFGMTGALAGLKRGYDVIGVIFLALITAVGGGLLRDILVREEPLLFKPGQFYALVAIGGACAYLGLLRWARFSPSEAATITICLVSTFRRLAIRFNWRTAAIYRMPPS